jgi:hypothetical protein
MLSEPTSGYLILTATVLLASAAGLALARFAPWTTAARRAGIPIAFGLACAPFLTGLLAVIALGLFRGADHALHVGLVVAGLVVFLLLFLLARPPLGGSLRSLSGWTPWQWVFSAALFLYILALVINTAALPLIQNDSLEYAFVGRILFQSRDLAVYPAISPSTEASGFYGPWTHPPLYVALIYLAYIFQGSAEAPDLIKWISPWFALAGAGLVLALGNLRSRMTGILGALVFLSVPLFFLAASSAAIDPLPVLGMAMVFTAIAATEGPPGRRGLVQGAVLGAALWTHSQAILFLPLALAAVVIGEGIGDLRRTGRQVGVLLVAAAAVALWPYARNLQLYGSLVSDTPPVFAMPELAWGEYFRISRLIDSLSERIQYGLLKGWFAFESYSFSFWLMTVGVAFYLIQNKGTLRRILRLNRGVGALPEHWLLCAVGIMVLYFTGVVASMLLGIDLMIRNERYWLVLLPFIALFGANAILELRTCGEQRPDAGRRPSRMTVWISKLVYPVAAALFLLQAITLVAYGWRTYAKERFYLQTSADESHMLAELFGQAGYSAATPAFMSNPLVFVKPSEIPEHSREAQKRVVVYNTETRNDLVRWPNMRAMQFLKAETPVTATVLSFRAADMYYAGRRMLSGFDPRLIPLYQEQDPVRAFERLVNLGISHVYLPDYYNPCITNTVVQEILARPEFAELVFTDAGFQIFRLAPPQSGQAGEAFEFGPGVRPWTRLNQVTGGRKALAAISDSKAVLILSGSPPEEALGWPIFQRDWSTMWISGLGAWETPLAPEIDVPVSGGREYRIELDLEGHALVKIWLMELDALGRAIAAPYPQTDAKVKVGELVLSPTHPKRIFLRRFITHPQAASIRVGVEQAGHSRLKILTARLVPLGDPAH